MGEGWRPRRGGFRDDLGTRWARCGQVDEWGRLRRVLLLAPPGSIAAVTDPDAALFVGRPELGRMRSQCDAIAARYRALGVEAQVHVADSAPPNVVFARDLVWMTPEGAVIGRPAAEQRAGEERFASGALAALGVPIRATITAGTFEGADALWLCPGRVLVGVGRRTDEAALAQLGRLALELGATVEPVLVPASVQHLLGALNPIDRDLAAVHPDLGEGAHRILARERIRAVVVADDDERETRRAMNFVTLGPREVLMPSGCPVTREAYEACGVRCHEIDVGEYLLAAGALGCLTAIVHREGA
jgi:N-dimethylarginine dimethylaminohydrolase